MKEQFIPYEQALELKELGFKNNWNFKEYDTMGYLQHTGLLESHKLEAIDAPLWQQVFDWFRKEHNLISSIVISGIEDYQIYIHCLDRRNLMFFKEYKDGYFSKIINFFYSNKDNVYEEARLECLKKLIEIVKNE